MRLAPHSLVFGRNKMNRIRLFQLLVVISATSYIIWFCLPYFSGYLSEDQQSLAGYYGYGAILPVLDIYYYGSWFGFSLVASVGMFFIQNWARHLFLCLIILDIVLAPVSGFMVQAPLDTAFSSLSQLVDGAILLMAYTSPLSESFKNTPNNWFHSTSALTRRRQ